MTSERDILKRARDLIQAKQYDRARVLLQRIPDNAAAKVYLQKLDQIDPQPRTFEEAQEDLSQAQQEIAQAESELQQQQGTFKRGMRMNTALLVFFGTLLGSLIGAAADFGGAIETFERFQSLSYPEICVVGSSTILEEGQGMAAAWKAAFEETHNARIKINSTGSTGGIDVVADDGCAHILAMSEPMSLEQQQRIETSGTEITCAAEIGYDIIVFVTDINNPVTIAPRRAIVALLKGTEQRWGHVSTAFDEPATVIARLESGTTDLVMRQFAGVDTNGARDFPPYGNYVFCDSNAECLDKTLSINGSLYWVSAAWIRTQPEYFQVVSIVFGDDTSVNPLEADIDLDEYPAVLQRPLYLYVVKNSSASDEQMQLAREFLQFVRGVEGQQILEQNMFYAHFDQPNEVPVPLPEGFDPPGTLGREICKPF